MLWVVKASLIPTTEVQVALNSLVEINIVIYIVQYLPTSRRGIKSCSSGGEVCNDMPSACGVV